MLSPHEHPHGLRSRTLTAAVATCLLGGCSGSSPTAERQWPIPSRFELVSVNDRPLPAFDTAELARVFSGVIELYRPDSLRLIHTSRDRFYDRLPCEALRDVPETTGTAGLRLITDTSTSGCDELRRPHTDTHVVAYFQDGDTLRIPAATGRVAGDTLILEDQRRIGSATGTLLRTRTRRYVRVATPAPSRKPQN
jgi:hypothetical protein